MPSPTTFPLHQALAALEGLRAAANLPPEQFPVEAFVGMISDEVDALRGQGKTDAEIAGIIHASSGIEIAPEALALHYAPPEQRHGPPRDESSKP